MDDSSKSGMTPSSPIKSAVSRPPFGNDLVSPSKRRDRQAEGPPLSPVQKSIQSLNAAASIPTPGGSVSLHGQKEEATVPKEPPESPVKKNIETFNAAKAASVPMPGEAKRLQSPSQKSPSKTSTLGIPAPPIS